MSIAETSLEKMIVENPKTLYAIGTAMRNEDHLSDASMRAHRLLSMSALQGFVPAQYDLGIMHSLGEGCTKSRVRALMWFYVAARADKRAANRAQSLASQLPSREIKEALRLSQDFPRTRTLFQSASYGNDPVAMNALGQMYTDGKGLARDAILAATWFMRALALHQENAEAQFRLGVALLNGDGVEADAAEAMRLFALAAAQYHPEAQYQWAYCLEQDARDPSNLERAISLYRAAAGQGHAMAQHQMGVLLKSSEGMDSSEFAENVPHQSHGALFKRQHAPYLVQALAYFMQAAEQGNPDAQFELGLMLAQGFGTAQDFERAAVWYGQSARQGNVKAQFNLAFLYAHGQGVKQNYINACTWYSISARYGYAQAQKSLEIILKKMTPAEIERAEWQRDVFFNNLE